MNFEEIGKKFKKFSKDTVTEVQKMNEVRQLNSRANDEKKRINQIYSEMGKKLYDLYRDAPLEGFEKEIEEIEEKFRMIDLLQDQVREVKGVVLCPCCNMEVDATERFCSNCGNKMPEVFTIEDTEEAAALEDGEVTEVEAEVVEAEEAAEAEEEATEEAAAAEEAAEEAAEAAEEADEEAVEAAEEASAEEAAAEAAEEAAEAASADAE